MNTWMAGLTGEGVEDLHRNASRRASVSHKCISEDDDDDAPPATLAASRAVAPAPVAPAPVAPAPVAKAKPVAKKARTPRPATAGSLLSIEIEDGIQIPRLGAGRDGYPFGKLEVGQSFFIANAKSMTSLHRANKTLAPKEFTSRKMQKEGVPGYRVWRVK